MTTIDQFNLSNWSTSFSIIIFYTVRLIDSFRECLSFLQFPFWNAIFKGNACTLIRLYIDEFSQIDVYQMAKMRTKNVWWRKWRAKAEEVETSFCAFNGGELKYLKAPFNGVSISYLWALASLCAVRCLVLWLLLALFFMQF